MICIFARNVTDELASLVNQVDVIVDQNKARKMAAFVVLLSGDLESVEQRLTVFAKRHGIKRVPLTVFDGVTGPANYAIAQNAEVTVMMWDGEKKLVRANHTFGKGEISKSFITKVVADVSLADRRDGKPFVVRVEVNSHGSNTVRDSERSKPTSCV